MVVYRWSCLTDLTVSFPLSGFASPDLWHSHVQGALTPARSCACCGLSCT
uniref:Uncharacterized protein n=1 Tax=Zea mays TaxID=4577 RepID=B7ZZH0_MAIZE|nr:unknown [Zea mays]